jgi:hypothetical protein
VSSPSKESLPKTDTLTERSQKVKIQQHDFSKLSTPKKKELNQKIELISRIKINTTEKAKVTQEGC